MGLFSNQQNTSGGLFGSSTGGSSVRGPSNSFDLNTSEGLLNIARSKGGNIAEAAEEIANPTTGILSTIGNGLKNSFKGFVDVISIPNQIVAGAISKDYTVGEAIKENISTSDVIFGELNPDSSTMQKVGGFVARTAVDMLLDPLTYVTFGASGSMFGAKAVSKITVRGAAAKSIGLADEAAVALSKEGVQTLNYLKKVEAQVTGLTKGIDMAERLKYYKEGKAIRAASGLGDEAFDLAGDELKTLLRSTIDAPLDPDFAKLAMSNLLEKAPQLTETLLDKGGMKFFNQTILSGQRIRTATRMVPGMTALDNMTAPIRGTLNAMFDPKMVKNGDKWVRVPEEYNDIIQKAKDLADSMKDDRVGQLSNIISGNKLTTTEAKFLTAAVEAGKMPSDPRLANAFKQLMGYNDKELDFLRSQGIRVSKLDNHAPHILNKQKDNGAMMFRPTPPKEAVNAAKQRKIEGSIFSGDFEQLDEVEKALLGKSQKKADDLLAEMVNDGFEGFEQNLLVAHTMRSMDNVSAGVTKDMLKTVSENFGIKAANAPEGYVGLKFGSFGKEEEFFKRLGLDTEAVRFHPAIAKHLETFVGSAISDPASNEFLKAFDSIQNLWKASVTSIFPAFHGRNALSNVFLNFNDIGLEALNPKTSFQATQMLKWDMDVSKLSKAAAGIGDDALKAQDELTDLLAKDIFTDAFGKKWSFGELRQTMKNNNIAFNEGIVGPIDITKGTDEIVSSLPFNRSLIPTSKSEGVRLAKKVLPVGQDFKPFVVGRRVGKAVEEQSRALNFMTNLRKTGDVTLAAQRTKQFLFDYNNLTNFERTFMKRLLPFYSFTRKNLEAQMVTLFSSPGRTAAQITAVTNLGDAISGQKLTKEEEAALPEWIKSGISILKSKNGGIAEIFGSLGTPIEAPFSSLQPNALLGSLSPLMRVPMEEATGYNFFQGKPISEVTNATAFARAPKFVKDMIGYTEIQGNRSDGSTYTMNVALRPKMMHLFLNLPPTTRVLTALKQMETVDVSTQGKIAQQLIGVKAFSFDLEQEQQKREKELRGDLEELLTNAGVTYQFTRTFIPKQNK